MIRWWRTGWAPIQQALNDQRRRDTRRLSGWVWSDGGWHLPVLDIPAIEGVTVRVISDADIREATIAGLRKIKADPCRVRLTKGQRDHIVNGKRTVR